MSKINFVYVRRTFECPYCEGQFERVQTKESRPPAYCELCGADVRSPEERSDDGKSIKKISQSRPVPKPRRLRDKNVRTGIATKSVDGLYRNMESAAESRIQDAADILGVSPSSLNSMKFTNMRDNAKVGEQSHIPTAATQITGSSVHVDGVSVGQMAFQQNQQAVEYAKDVSKGPNAAAGKQFRDSIVSGHQMRVAQVARAGQLNKK